MVQGLINIAISHFVKIVPLSLHVFALKWTVFSTAVHLLYYALVASAPNVQLQLSPKLYNIRCRV